MMRGPTWYAEKLAHILDQMPVDRAVLGLFCDLIHRERRWVDGR